MTKTWIIFRFIILSKLFMLSLLSCYIPMLTIWPTLILLIFPSTSTEVFHIVMANTLRQAQQIHQQNRYWTKSSQDLTQKIDPLYYILFWFVACLKVVYQKNTSRIHGVGILSIVESAFCLALYVYWLPGQQHKINHTYWDPKTNARLSKRFNVTMSVKQNLLWLN